jgi:DNA topoisomerase III
MLYAKKIAQGKDVVIPEEAKANSAAMSQWIDSHRSAKRDMRGGKTAHRVAGAVAAQSTATTKRSRKRKAAAATTPHPASSAPQANFECGAFNSSALPPVRRLRRVLPGRHAGATVVPGVLS